MKINCKYDSLVEIGKIEKHPRNVNEHPDIQLRGLEVTLKENEIRHPLIVSKLSGRLVAGHARLEVMRRLGLKKVPVVYQDFDSEEKEFQFMVSDNESARRAWLNPEAFDLHMGQLKFEDSVDMNAFGIYDESTPKPKKGATPDGEEEETQEGESKEGESKEVEDVTGAKQTYKVPLEFSAKDYKVFLRFIDSEKKSYPDESVSNIVLNYIKETFEF